MSAHHFDDWSVCYSVARQFCPPLEALQITNKITRKVRMPLTPEQDKTIEKNWVSLVTFSADQHDVRSLKLFLAIKELRGQISELVVERRLIQNSDTAWRN